MLVLCTMTRTKMRQNPTGRPSTPLKSLKDGISATCSVSLLPVCSVAPASLQSSQPWLRALDLGWLLEAMLLHLLVSFWRFWLSSVLYCEIETNICNPFNFFLQLMRHLYYERLKNRRCWWYLKHRVLEVVIITKGPKETFCIVRFQNLKMRAALDWNLCSFIPGQMATRDRPSRSNSHLGRLPRLTS